MVPQLKVKLQRALHLMYHSSTSQIVLSMQLFFSTVLSSEKSNVLNMQATHYFNIFYQGCHQKKVVGLPMQLSPCVSWIPNDEKMSEQPCDCRRGLLPQKNRQQPYPSKHRSMTFCLLWAQRPLELYIFFKISWWLNICCKNSTSKCHLRPSVSINFPWQEQRKLSPGNAH